MPFGSPIALYWAVFVSQRIVPDNIEVLAPQSGFNKQWYTYLDALKNANLSTDFSGITTPDPSVSLTNDELRDLLIQILTELKT